MMESRWAEVVVKLKCTPREKERARVSNAASEEGWI